MIVSAESTQDKLNDFQLIENLTPLMKDGIIFYKKFSSMPNLKSKIKAFDPLVADKYPPEACGYGVRHF